MFEHKNDRKENDRTLFQIKIQFDPPKRPLRDAFPPQNTIQIRLRACRRPSILSPVKPLRHQTLETPFRRFNKVPIPWGGTPKGTQGNPRYPRVPKGAFGALGGGWAHGAPWGYTEAIPNGTPFRLDGYYETTPKLKPWLESRVKPLEDQGGLGSEIMPRYAQMVHGQHWARNNQTICTKTDHLVACAAADLK